MGIHEHLDDPVNLRSLKIFPNDSILERVPRDTNATHLIHEIICIWLLEALLAR